MFGVAKRGKVPLDLQTGGLELGKFIFNIYIYVYIYVHGNYLEFFTLYDFKKKISYFFSALMSSQLVLIFL